MPDRSHNRHEFGVPLRFARRRQANTRAVPVQPWEATMADPESVPSVIRLLIADDHPALREGLRSIFSRDPQVAVVAVAATGDEAVVLTERLRPDVVLMDLQMPGLDGVSAIR